MRRPALLAATLAALLPSAAPAVDVNDGQLTVHGYGQWSYQRTDNGNSAGDAAPGGNYDTAMFDLVLTVKPARDLVVTAQLGFEPEGTELEWAFAEWRFADALRLRVGKIRQPFGNLNELRFAGTTRAFYDLPAGFYGPGKVTGSAYLGLGLTGEVYAVGDWALAYDLYGGAVDLAEPVSYRGLETAGAVGEPVEPEEHEARDLVGGRLSITTPGEVTLRASGYGGSIEHEETASKRLWVGGLSAEYRGERLWLSAEAAVSVVVGVESARTAYVSAAWFLTDEVQVALRYEHQRTRLEDLDPSYRRSHPLLRHEQLSVGLNYWVDPGFVFKAAWSGLEGNRFAFPTEVDGAPVLIWDLPAMTLEQRTQVFLVGTQFAF